MRLNPKELPAHLKQGLASCYLVFGEETLTAQSCVEAIRKAATDHGYSYQWMITQDDFEPEALQYECQNLGLFDAKKIVHLKVVQTEIKKELATLLKSLVPNLPEETCLLITAGKLESRAQKAAWFNTVDKHGQVVRCWPVAETQMPSWVRQQFLAHSVQPSDEVCEYIAQHTQGNLNAASQMIAQIALHQGAGPLALSQVVHTLENVSEHTVYQWVDKVLQGDAQSVFHMLKQLIDTGTALPVVLWALANDIRLMLKIAYRVKAGDTLNKAIQAEGVWQKRQPLLQKALQRLEVATLEKALQDAAQVDRLLKGAEIGNERLALERLCLLLANGRGTI